MYKLIAIDLDDTLLNDKNEISNENLEALKYAKSKGVKIVICTGRPTLSTSKYIEIIEDYSLEDYFIVFNGSIITSKAGHTIFRKVINKDLLHKLIDFGRNEDVDIQIYDEKNIFVERYSSGIQDYENNIALKATMINDLKEKDMTVKVLYNSNDKIKLERIKTEIEKQFKNEVFVFYSRPNYLEVLSHEGNKGIALEYLADYLGINQKDVIAIGDSENDSYMIKYAGLGVCMKNGRESIKDIADYITERTNLENGVAEVIRKFVK